MKILLGIDGSPDAQAALEYVLGGPHRPEDRFAVITVAQPGLLSGTGLRGKGTPPDADLDEVAGSILDDAVAAFRRAGREVEAVLRYGDPADKILEYAEESGSDLIVVGAQGHGRIRRFLLGSVADRVARFAHAPAIVVRPPGAPPRSILAATDGSESARDAAMSLAALPLPEGARAHVLAVVPPITDGLYGAATTYAPLLNELEEAIEEQETAAGAAASELAERLGAAGLPSTHGVVRGKPADEIVRVARECSSDLVAVGTRGRTGLAAAFLGSTASSVLRHAPCSVFVGPRRATASESR
jgi:nucleotide-binding universal stress UspA family protein